jgi:hypothetical protein
LYLGDNLGHISIHLDNCFTPTGIENKNTLWNIVKEIFSLLSWLFKSLQSDSNSKSLPSPFSDSNSKSLPSPFSDSNSKSLPSPFSVPAEGIYDRELKELETDFVRMRFTVDGKKHEDIETIKRLADWDAFKTHQGKFLGSVSQSNQSQSCNALLRHFPIERFHSKPEQDTTVKIDTQKKTVTMTRTFSIYALNDEDAPVKTACQRIQSVTTVFFNNPGVTMEIHFENAPDNKTDFIPVAVGQG